MNRLSQLIREDMKPALGGTEPGAIAFASAKARSYTVGPIESVLVSMNSGMYKNAFTCGIPNSNEVGNIFAAALGVVQPVLCEINVGEEPQKAGIMADALPELEEHVLARCPHLEMQGLMCLPPVFDAGEAARPYFARLYRLREDMRARTGLPLPHLSMGMSGDFAAAVAEGATLVRIGTDIFGPRPPKVPA